MEAYRRVIDISIENDDRELAEKETAIFNEQLDRFGFYQDSPMEDLPEIPGEPPPMDTVPDTTSEEVTPGQVTDSIPSAQGNGIQ